jgi:hypothetical protein
MNCIKETTSASSESNINDEWAKFINEENSSDCEDSESEENNMELSSTNLEFKFNIDTPKSNAIYISTKTKIAYLNSKINLNPIFWDIQVMPYSTSQDGVIKKQIKFNSFTIEELNDIQTRLKDIPCYEENVLTSINNPTGRIKFKDIRKVSIGICKKDIMSYRSKKKSAFYNCFVLILRLKINTVFREFHVKVFNTGKLEIPGIQSEYMFERILEYTKYLLQPYIPEKLMYVENSTETVLINSNFNCGFFINREVLHDILKYKYNIQSIYDACSYPGIQSKFYYNPDVTHQTGSQISDENKTLYKNIKPVSFMIFRTGSVLIVGKCDEPVVMIIYEFVKTLLNNEFKQICQKNMKIDDVKIIKKKKIRRKMITLDI